MITLLAVFGWFVAILILSTLMVNIYRHVRTAEFKFVLDIVLFIGVVIHELAHACTMLCVGIVPKSFAIRYRSPYSGRAAPHGGVGYKDSDDLKLTFMQGLLVSLAPLFSSTFIFLFMLDIIFNTDSPVIIKVIAVIIMISVIIGSYPSNADLNGLMGNFSNRPTYSLYQISLAVFSVLIVVFAVDLTFLKFPFEVFYYIVNCGAMIGIFLGLKYTLLTFKIVIQWIYSLIKKREEIKQTFIVPNPSNNSVSKPGNWYTQVNMPIQDQNVEGEDYL
jgi:hypothetical protein